LATSDELQQGSGLYFEYGQAVRSSPHTYDNKIAERLWNISAELTGLDSD
jgi:hypothetical protein